jgi:DNA excision repair protein ERCC-2
LLRNQNIALPFPVSPWPGADGWVSGHRKKSRKIWDFFTASTPCAVITFHIQGRIDGLYETHGRFEIEEIKSVLLTAKEFTQVTADYFPDYKEQVLIYSYLLQKEQGGAEVVPYLRLINLINDKSKIFKLLYHPSKIEKLLDKRCRNILDKLAYESVIQEARREQLKLCRFRLAETRPQQKRMMQQIEQTLQKKEHVLVSAPTGTGKTAGALFPAIRFAFKNNKKIFFITAKTTQQAIVSETLQPVLKSPLDIHILFLRRSRDMCCNEVYLCHRDYCPYAKDYYDRLVASNIIATLLQQKEITPDSIFNQAKAQTLCPAEVMMDLTLQVDMIVGDYNYVFDPGVYLRRLFFRNDYANWILIIDEAHNLYDRGMGYYSPDIKRHEIDAILKQVDKGKKNSKVYRRLLSSLQEIETYLQAYHQHGETYHTQQACYIVTLDQAHWQRLFEQYESAYINYCIYKIRKKIIIKSDPFELFYYRLRHLIQVIPMQGDAYISYFSAEQKGALKIQCTDPADPLGRRIEGFHSVIAMSATLDPIGYYKRILGFPNESTRTLLVDSPFPAGNRQLIIIPEISTRYRERHTNYVRYAEIIEQVVQLRKGNYIIFCPSFEFLHNLYLFMGKIGWPKIIQRPQMDTSAREEVINQLKERSQPALLLAVLGGIFAEGIDLRGDMCIGVIIFSPGLPKVSYERELIARYFDKKEGSGFAYAYLYPGINKVIQAAGRLIRSAQDKGIIVLVDDRFADREVIELLPAYWFKEPSSVAITTEYQEVIRSFWAGNQSRKGKHAP